MIGLGLVNSIEEVQNLVDLVDEDGSGMIEFNEFLDIIQNKGNDSKASIITNFFQDLTSGKFKTEGLSFLNWVLKEQRGHLMDAVKPGPISERKVKGKQILNALRSVKQLEEEEELAKAA